MTSFYRDGSELPTGKVSSCPKYIEPDNDGRQLITGNFAVAKTYQYGARKQPPHKNLTSLTQQKYKDEPSLTLAQACLSTAYRQGSYRKNTVPIYNSTLRPKGTVNVRQRYGRGTEKVQERYRKGTRKVRQSYGRATDDSSFWDSCGYDPDAVPVDRQRRAEVAPVRRAAGKHLKFNCFKAFWGLLICKDVYFIIRNKIIAPAVLKRFIYLCGYKRTIRMSLTCLLALISMFSLSAQTPRKDSGADGLNNIKPLEIGDSIPKALWKMPLAVINHPDGKETVTLADYKDKKIIVLDFWASYCSPCIRSIAKIDAIVKDEDLKGITMLLPVLVHDAPERGGRFLKDWNSSMWSIDDGNFQLKFLFSNYISGFGVVLISDGKFVAAPSAKDISYEKLKRQAFSQPVEWMNVSRKGVER